MIEVKRIGRDRRASSSCSATRSDSTSTATLAPTVGMFVATRIKPQARVFAESRGRRSASRSTSKSCAPARRRTCACSNYWPLLEARACASRGTRRSPPARRAPGPPAPSRRCAYSYASGWGEADLGVERLLAETLRRPRCPGWRGAAGRGWRRRARPSGTTRLTRPQSAAVRASIGVAGHSRARAPACGRELRADGDQWRVAEPTALPARSGEAGGLGRDREVGGGDELAAGGGGEAVHPGHDRLGDATASSIISSVHASSSSRSDVEVGAGEVAKSWPAENTGPLAARITPRALLSPAARNAAVISRHAGRATARCGARAGSS